MIARVPRTLLRTTVVVVAVAAAGCRLPYIPYVTKPSPAAVARLVDASGRAVGNAVLVDESGGIRVIIDVNGMTPGDKGVHVHEVGRCDPPAFESAGAHFNPGKHQHGSKNPRGPHAGDLPNLTVDASGRGYLGFTAKGISLDRKAANSVLDANGSAVVVHEHTDDLRTDPSGNSGARIACGVIVSQGKL